MTRPIEKLAFLLATCFALAILPSALSLKTKKLLLLKRLGRDTSGHFHPELHGDGARGHFHSVHVHSQGAGNQGDLTSISASSSSGGINDIHGHNIDAANTVTGQVVPSVGHGHGYGYDEPPAPPSPPFPHPPPVPVQPNCGCMERDRCDQSLRSYTETAIRTIETIRCGTAFELCCYPDPWEPAKDIFRHLAPCVPTEECVHGYGTQPTDVALFGQIGPCLGLGTVRCMDRIAPQVSAIPIPAQEGPLHYVIPIIDYPIPPSPPVPIVPELPIPTTVYETPGPYIPLEPSTSYGPPVPVPVPQPPVPVIPPVYQPPVVQPPTTYDVPNPVVVQPPRTTYHVPVPVVEPPEVYKPPVVQPPSTTYDAPTPVVVQPPPTTYHVPVPVVEPPQVYKPPVVQPPPTTYAAPVPVPPTTYAAPVPVPPTTYAAPIPVPPTTYAAPVPVPPTTYAAPVPVVQPPTSYSAPRVQPPVTYGVPGTSYGEPLSNYVSNNGQFGSFGGYPYGYSGYGGYYPGLSTGFGFRKRFGISKGFGFFG